MGTNSPPPGDGRGGRLAPRLGQEPERAARGPFTGSVVERVVAAATHLFAAQGYERTSVQEIVDAAGVAKGAMYHYFTGKDDLLFEVYHRILAMQLERLRAVAATDAPIEDRVYEAAADVIATTIDNFDQLTVVARCLHLLGPLQQSAVRAERRRYHELFRGMIIDGQTAGVLDDGIDPDLAVDFFFGAVHHLPAWFDPTGRLSGRDLGEAYAHMLLKALGTGP